MAHKKAQWSTTNGRDSNAKRLGVKLFGGQKAISGNIILRQKGNKFWAAEGTSTGRDFTIFATQEGRVKFTENWSDKLPLSLSPNIFYETKPLVIKKQPKVSVIIPSKNNFKLLENCLSSIVKKSNYENLWLFHVFWWRNFTICNNRFENQI